MRGYQASRVQDGRHSTRKENTLNKCLKQFFFFNYFTCYSGANTQIQTFHWLDLDGSITNMVEISNDCTCVTEKLFVVLYRQ